MTEHIKGFILALAGLLASAGSWFLLHLDVINRLMQFGVLALSLPAAYIGLRKLLK